MYSINGTVFQIVEIASFVPYVTREAFHVVSYKARIEAIKIGISA